MRSSMPPVFCQPRIIATLPSRLARRMSSVVRAWISRSSCSTNHRFHWAMFRIVPRNPSQTEHVQFAALSPPRCMSSNTARLHFEMISPSMTMASRCKSVIVAFPSMIFRAG